ncbi:hypothetical protein AVEN_17038-1, partial [Araneus ventricosus]
MFKWRTGHGMLALPHPLTLKSDTSTVRFCEHDQWRTEGGPEAAHVLKQIDGVDLWPSFVHNLPSPRQEVLLNIDSLESVEGIRWKNFKLVKGSYYDGRYDGWYD